MRIVAAEPKEKRLLLIAGGKELAETHPGIGAATISGQAKVPRLAVGCLCRARSPSFALRAACTPASARTSVKALNLAGKKLW